MIFVFCGRSLGHMGEVADVLDVHQVSCRLMLEIRLPDTSSPLSRAMLRDANGNNVSQSQVSRGAF